jgi:hypothetical protein
VDASPPAPAPAVGEPSSRAGVAGLAIGATVDRLEAHVADVEAALASLERGTYGSCELCGEMIDEGRLTEDPTTRRCAGHGSS